MSTIVSNPQEPRVWSAPSASLKLHSRARETEAASCAGVTVTKSLERIEIPQCIYDSCVGLGLLSQDPIGFAGGDANLYRYVGNHPTLATDPSGLIGDDWWNDSGWDYVNPFAYTAWVGNGIGYGASGVWYGPSNMAADVNLRLLAKYRIAQNMGRDNNVQGTGNACLMGETERQFTEIAVRTNWEFQAAAAGMASPAGGGFIRGNGGSSKPSVGKPTPGKPATPSRVASNPKTGRFDFEHSTYDSAIVGARKNAGNLGTKTNKMFDPKTGTLIGEMSDCGKRGWRIDNDHINWWDWTAGKKGAGGKYGHDFFPPSQAGPHSEHIGYAPWE